VTARPPLLACIFDWGGTLTPWHTVEPVQAWVAAVDDPAVAARLWEAERVLWRRQQDDHRSGGMAEVLAIAGVDPTDVRLEEFHHWWEPHPFAYPDAIDVLRALRERGLKIGVLSNTLWPGVEHDRIFARDGLTELIDAAVYTSEIEWTKPHPEAFGAVLTALGITDPASAVFVGDRRFDDIHGAKSAGMRAVLIPHSDIPADQHGHTQGEPDAVIEQLTDLLPIIDGWRT
jgi:putative hydrolase of the HAD superfamily